MQVNPIPPGDVGLSVGCDRYGIVGSVGDVSHECRRPADDPSLAGLEENSIGIEAKRVSHQKLE